MHIIEGKMSELSPGFVVRRLLPSRFQRMVGPFCFLDHAGPVEIVPHQNMDVRPHPHIGLSTLTYLLEGRQIHRDSLGCVVEIYPGDINLMTAGKGIAHSERSFEEDRAQERRLYLLQFWLALPDGKEEIDPQFNHYDKKQLPVIENQDCKVKVLAGEFLKHVAPTVTFCPTLLCDIEVKQDHQFQYTSENFELAIVPLKGTVKRGDQLIESSHIAIYKPGEPIDLDVSSGAQFILLGGEPFKTERHIWWNLVSSSKERIEIAKKQWASGTFPMVPNETEFIPLPKV